VLNTFNTFCSVVDIDFASHEFQLVHLSTNNKCPLICAIVIFAKKIVAKKDDRTKKPLHDKL